MAFDKLMETLKEEIAQEMALREEIVYKKGYLEGFSAGTEDIDLRMAEYEDSTVESYVQGICEAFDVFKTLVEMSGADRIETFGGASLTDIMDAYDPFEIFDRVVLFEADKKEEQEENACFEFIGAILDCEVSDEAKMQLLGNIKIADLFK